METVTLPISVWEKILSNHQEDDYTDDEVSTTKSNDFITKKDTNKSDQKDTKNTPSKKSDKKKTKKKPTKKLGEIVVMRASKKNAVGKYGTYTWKAKNIEGHWKIYSKIPLTVGQKSSVSAKINKYLEEK